MIFVSQQVKEMNREILSARATLSEPATDEEITTAQTQLGCLFSPEYARLLQVSNGLSPHSDTASPCLYDTQALAQFNEVNQIARYLPQLFQIGDDGGGRGIFLSRSPDDTAVYRLDLGALFADEAVTLAPSLPAWIFNNFDLKDRSDRHELEYVDVYLVRRPKGGSKALLAIKNLLKLEVPIIELYQALEQLPHRLRHIVRYHQYAELCAAYNQVDDCLALFEVNDLSKPVPIPPYLMAKVSPYTPPEY
jgi:hypothetical protein